MTPAIVNCHGNVDLTTTKLSKRYQHIEGKRLQPLCRKLKIEYAEAIVGFEGSRRYGYKPVKNGVIMSAQAAPKLLAAMADRACRCPPELAEERQRKREEQRMQRLREAGIANPSSRTAYWFERGEIDSYEAQLIQFKVGYRHEHTDYDELLNEGYDRDDARHFATDTTAIPCDWKTYLSTFGFPYSHVGEAISKVLMRSQHAHPVWFCEAVIATRRAELDLNALTYEGVRKAIDDWRCERNSDEHSE